MLAQRMEVEEGYDLAMKEFTPRKVLPMKSEGNSSPGDILDTSPTQNQEPRTQTGHNAGAK